MPGPVLMVTRPMARCPGAYDPVMTTPLADSNPQILHAATIGAAWLAVARRIIAEGIVTCYDDLPVREISLVTLAIDRPDPGDEVIARYGEPGRLAWMNQARLRSRVRRPAAIA